MSADATAEGARGAGEERVAEQPGSGGVAAVMLSWNDADRVIDFVGRLRALDPPPERIVVVDNASEGAGADRIEAALPGVELVRSDRNRGFAGGINLGIERALGPGIAWIWVLNTDLELPRDAGSRLLAALDRGERIGAAGPVLVEEDGSVQTWGGGRVDLRTGVSRHVLGPGEELDYLCGACLMLRRAALEDVGPLAERYFFYWEDTDFGFRLRERGWRLAVAEDCRVVHQEGSTLGRWSASRWEQLFCGLATFLAERSPRPRLALAYRLLHHCAAMAAHGRWQAALGAWRGALRGLRRRSDTA